MAVTAVFAVGGWAMTRTFQTPVVEPVSFTREDGVRAQQKIVDLALHRGRRDPVLLTEAEVNAFVSRHLDPAELPVRGPVIRLHDGDALEIIGTVPLGRLLRESPVAGLAEILPAWWLARPIWLSIAAHAATSVDGRRTLRLEPKHVLIGRQRAPAFALRVLFDPSSLRLMRIPLPSEIQAVRIQSGRVIIQPATSPPSRT